ncbi:YdeI/OmpD-associated family protein [Aquipseudomonas alcaligenes]|uniref:YdeI/OmpD-associated family protein n=1 Tax=Aquipseudomonas alcaligenes TaxID=43263 RepID=UPI003747AA0A
MTASATPLTFSATLQRPAKPDGDVFWAFVLLPKEISEQLSRRGRVTVAASLNEQNFQVTLEPDGQLSHWLRLSRQLCEAAGVQAGASVNLEIMQLPQEPEPEVPADLHEALQTTPAALAVWNGTTSLARLDWIHWITSAKQLKTRSKRINDACDMLASGKQRVCCFDPSGFYSKAFCAPAAAP